MVEPEYKSLVDIAAEVMSDETSRMGISYSGFCLTGLPHRRLPDNEVWIKRGHKVTLQVEPGTEVAAGQSVASIEAMKMEAAITAPVAGVVERVAIPKTQQVEAGDLLVVVRPQH